MISFSIENLAYDYNNRFTAFDELEQSLEALPVDSTPYISGGVPGAWTDSLDALAIITPVFIAATRQ